MRMSSWRDRIEVSSTRWSRGGIAVFDPLAKEVRQVCKALGIKGTSNPQSSQNQEVVDSTTVIRICWRE
jgi:hypothetical protein